MRCKREMIEWAAYGRLSAVQYNRVRRHLDECWRCSRQWKHLRLEARAFAELQKVGEPAMSLPTFEAFTHSLAQPQREAKPTRKTVHQLRQARTAKQSLRHVGGLLAAAAAFALVLAERGVTIGEPSDSSRDAAPYYAKRYDENGAQAQDLEVGGACVDDTTPLLCGAQDVESFDGPAESLRAPNAEPAPNMTLAPLDDRDSALMHCSGAD